jgi:hypothetical protein
MLAADRDSEPRIWTAVLISAALGGLLGLFVYPAPQFTLEAAQVIGGVIDLPPDNPMEIFDTSAYSLFLVQIPALLFAAGSSATALSLLLSAAQGAAAFAAVTLVSLAVSRSAAIGLLTPFLLLHISFASHKYPILYPTAADNGPMLGFYGVLAAISLIALGKNRSGGLLLGLLPAFNPVLGLAGWLGAGVALLAERGRQAGLLRRIWPYFAAGAGVFLLTLAVQMLVIRDVQAGIPGDTATRLTEEFIRYWDGHRMPYFETDRSTPLEFFKADVAFVVLAILLLTSFRRSFPASVRLPLIALIAITAVAAAFTAVDEISPGLFPVFVKSLLVTRWLNWSSFALPIVVISALGYLALRDRSVVALAAFALLLLPARATILGVGLGALVVYALFPAVRRATQSALGLAYGRGASPAVGALAVLAAAGLFIASMTDAHKLRLDQGNPVWSEARRGDGLIITPPIYFVSHPAYGKVDWPQLRSGRPILLDTGLMNNMVYVPSAAPGMERILNRVYGTSIYDGASNSFFIQSQALWESRSERDWQAIGAEYGATNLIADSRWHIELPERAHGGGVRLYEIPRTGVSG